MRRMIQGLGAALLAAASLTFAQGSSQTSQHLVLKVSSFGVLGVSGNPRALLVEPGSDANDDSTALRFSSAVSRDARRTIVAQMESGSGAPSGCSLSLTARPSRTGAEGVSAGEIILSEGPQSVIVGIGSCATGLGPGDGAVLRYRLRVENPARLISGESKRVTVLFTLMDAF
jgi:hypothetical protein